MKKMNKDKAMDYAFHQTFRIKCKNAFGDELDHFGYTNIKCIGILVKLFSLDCNDKIILRKECEQYRDVMRMCINENYDVVANAKRIELLNEIIRDRC